MPILADNSCSQPEASHHARGAHATPASTWAHLSLTGESAQAYGSSRWCRDQLLAAANVTVG
eukprot:8741285-Pyramimonas_sp.AAC.1